MSEMRVHPSGSHEYVTDDERSALKLAGLWDDDSYPEFSMDQVLDAYRAGYEDGAR